MSSSDEASTPSEYQLIASDPEVRADDFLPALWVPLSRVIRARRRITTMFNRAPAAWWQGESACADWRRRDVLAHLVAWDGQHLRSLDAILAGGALDSASCSRIRVCMTLRFLSTSSLSHPSMAKADVTRPMSSRSPRDASFSPW